MNVVLVFIVTVIVLFALAFITKRRFGVLGLALAAGAMLSALWAERLTPIIKNIGLKVEAPPLLTLVSVGLVLLPAILLLFSGPSYKKLPARVIGAILFAVLALALLIEPLGSALILTGQEKDVYDLFVQNRVYVVTGTLIIALLDILTTKTPKLDKHVKH